MSTAPEPHDKNHHMSLALSCARKSPPKPTNFCVGAVLLIPSSSPSQSTTAYETITGYTLELPGNTHAEQCCFTKAAESHNHLPAGCVLYTTMEPCNARSVGNKPCVDRILALKTAEGEQAIEKVYVGVSEPETFVGVNAGKRKLEEAGIVVEKVEGFEEEILSVATAGHVKEGEERQTG